MTRAEVLRPLATAALGLVATLAAVAAIALIVGENPFATLRTLIVGGVGSVEALAFTLFYATDFIFSGLAVAVAFRAGLFNIGAEGQALVAGVGVAIAALWDIPLPMALRLMLAIIGAVAAGALWALIPAWLRARRGSHIVITTIMFNFLASALVSWLLVDVMRAPGSMQPETSAFPDAARMPRFDDLLGALGLPTTGSPLNVSFLIALAAAAAVYILIFRTRAGYEMRVFGASPDAAAYAGISAGRAVLLSMAVSGALAGGVAINELLGAQNRLILDFTAGAGFVGIAVALMGRNHPLGIIFAALLFGALYQGGAELAFDRPRLTRDLIVVVQGLVVFIVGGFTRVGRR